MSIIQEALKKAQGTYTKVESKISAEPVIVNGIPSAKSHHPPFNVPMVIPAVIVLTIVIGFGLKAFFTDTSKVKAVDSSRAHQEVSYKITEKEKTVEPITASIQNSIPTAFIASQAPNLTLNGIMYLKDSPRAIINGNMVEEGDSISGAKVTAINKSNVTLNYNNTEINLKLKE